MYSAPEGTAGPEEIQVLKDMYTAKGVPEPNVMITEAGYTTTDDYVKNAYISRLCRMSDMFYIISKKMH